MDRSLRVLLFIAAAGLTAAFAAQTPTTLRVNVRLVSLVATVTDTSGKFVPNLGIDDFSVEDDGVRQNVVHFTQDHNVPVSVGILLDTSGSMDRRLRTATAAVGGFINKIHEDDDIFLMTFDRSVSLEQDFTSDRRKLLRVLDSIRLGGGTVLYDGLKEGLEKVQKGRHDKRAILLITDGLDTGSRTSVPKLIDAIRGVEVLVYGLGTAEVTYADPVEHVPFVLPTPQGRGPAPIVNAPSRGGGRRGTAANTINGVNMSILTQFAEDSGGKAFLLTETFVNEGHSEIEEILTLIAEELRSQYTLGYYPTAADDGRVHSIKVTTRAGHTVRTRSSYLAK
jgi:VWFA-related protein